MKRHKSPFKWRHYAPDVTLLCVRWYCRYSLSYRDLEEMMRERGPTPATGEAREGMLSRLGPALARSRRRRGEG